ncbi:hypothetical protein B296_00054864 [Ensete ventricosum]|uniref:Uncharacterized protein n=1 Tax=Ensete ventricosum TaxID=4639 RepID=A0A426XZ06_ENSVE|nr:hypothetical protein B296_00054864 [Ensete ventricosum]
MGRAAWKQWLVAQLGGSSRGGSSALEEEKIEGIYGVRCKRRQRRKQCWKQRREMAAEEAGRRNWRWLRSKMAIEEVGRRDRRWLWVLRGGQRWWHNWEAREETIAMLERSTEGCGWRGRRWLWAAEGMGVAAAGEATGDAVSNGGATESGRRLQEVATVVADEGAVAGDAVSNRGATESGQRRWRCGLQVAASEEAAVGEKAMGGDR